jgi:hypothetical protein
VVRRRTAGFERGVGATHLAEQFDGELSSGDADRVIGADPTELARGPSCRQLLRQATFGELTQHGVEPADTLGPARGEVMVSPGEQPQHDIVVLVDNAAQSLVAQTHDRSRACVVTVGLVAALGVESTDSRRELRRNIDHGLTGGDQLLRQEQPQTACALDRPRPRRERLRERKQALSLATVSSNTELVEHSLVAVDDRRVMRSLVGIDSDDEHGLPPRPSW